MAPTVIHGKPSPRVGRRWPPPPAVATLGSVDDVVEDGAGLVVAVGAVVTVWAWDTEPATHSIPSVSSPEATARRTGATVMDGAVG